MTVYNWNALYMYYLFCPRWNFNIFPFTGRRFFLSLVSLRFHTFSGCLSSSPVSGGGTNLIVAAFSFVLHEFCQQRFPWRFSLLAVIFHGDSSVRHCLTIHNRIVPYGEHLFGRPWRSIKTGFEIENRSNGETERVCGSDVSDRYTDKSHIRFSVYLCVYVRCQVFCTRLPATRHPSTSKPPSLASD